MQQTKMALYAQKLYDRYDRNHKHDLYVPRIPDPVPPAIEWHNKKPSRLSLSSASLSIISMMSSATDSPWKGKINENKVRRRIIKKD